MKLDTLEHELASSDILLVTDGELPNPPVSNIVMAKLESLRQKSGMEVHGLLVGRKESPALSSLCNAIHDFLVDYELLDHVTLGNRAHGRKASTQLPTSTALLAHNVPKSRGIHFHSRNRANPRHPLTLYAMRNSLCDNFSDMHQCHLLWKKDTKSGTKKRRFLDDDDEEWDFRIDKDNSAYDADSAELFSSSDFVQRLEDAYDSLQNKVSLEMKKWSKKELEKELTKSSIQSKRKILSDAISYVESGLIERDAEARLVVLGMVCQEHVMFIGPPGKMFLGLEVFLML